MSIPNLNEEKKLWKKGFKRVVGLDEVGRGCVAGPVVAAAVTIIKKSPFQKLWESDFHNIKDSKKLTPKKREEFYKILRNHPAIKWGLGKVSEKVIDKINILEATKLAMIRAIKNLERKPDFLIIDGNFKLNLPEPQRSQRELRSLFHLRPVNGTRWLKKGIYPLRLLIPQKSIVKADEKIFSVALASIIAKVTRDRMMKKYAKKFPIYGFEKHKGYGTKDHIKVLKKIGPCKTHRLSFNPVRACQYRE